MTKNCFNFFIIFLFILIKWQCKWHKKGSRVMWISMRVFTYFRQCSTCDQSYDGEMFEIFAFFTYRCKKNCLRKSLFFVVFEVIRVLGKKNVVKPRQQQAKQFTGFENIVTTHTKPGNCIPLGKFIQNNFISCLFIPTHTILI